MYSPYYQNQPGQDQYMQNVNSNLQHPQPQYQNADVSMQGMPMQGAPMGQMPQAMPQGMPQGMPPQAQNQQNFGNFFQDPTSSMAAQFARTSLGQSNDYIQQNFGSFIPPTSNLNYYFKISNSYVINKLILILFPFRNKNWVRATAPNVPTAGGTPGTVTTFLPPINDINAPDLYIPFMSFVTYILLWSVFQGVNGDFHPQLFGYLASQTLACSMIDILFFKIGLYLLNCSPNGSIWDIISFSGYKYVPIIALLCWKHLIGGGYFIYYTVVLMVTGSFSLFLMRSLRFLILPNTATGTATNSISISQRRIRIQFLFLYAVVLQFLINLFMSR